MPTLYRYLNGVHTECGEKHWQPIYTWNSQHCHPCTVHSHKYGKIFTCTRQFQYVLCWFKCLALWPLSVGPLVQTSSSLTTFCRSVSPFRLDVHLLTINTFCLGILIGKYFPMWHYAVIELKYWKILHVSWQVWPETEQVLKYVAYIWFHWKE